MTDIKGGSGRPSPQRSSFLPARAKKANSFLTPSPFKEAASVLGDASDSVVGTAQTFLELNRIADDGPIEVIQEDENENSRAHRHYLRTA